MNSLEERVGELSREEREIIETKWMPAYQALRSGLEGEASALDLEKQFTAYREAYGSTWVHWYRSRDRGANEEALKAMIQEFMINNIWFRGIELALATAQEQLPTSRATGLAAFEVYHKYLLDRLLGLLQPRSE